MSDDPTQPNDLLFQDIKQLIDVAKQQAALAITTNINSLLPQDKQLSPNISLKDPYILDFLELSNYELDKSSIHVAEYLTVLPLKELLQAKLQEAVASARHRLPYSRDEPS